MTHLDHCLQPAYCTKKTRQVKYHDGFFDRFLRHLMQHSRNMTFLVRQLAQTEYGLPLEIYVFSTDQRWVQYEKIQSDIFDHLFAALPVFDLRPFQNPTGYDMQHLSQAPEVMS